MKTFLLTLLKIGLVALLIWWLLHHAPWIAAPVVGGFGFFLLIALMLLIALVVRLGVGVAVVVALLGVMLAVAAALSPIWVPALAIFGLVALCRTSSRKNGNGATPA